jgi:hypothetical protein
MFRQRNLEHLTKEGNVQSVVRAHIYLATDATKVNHVS